MTGSHPENAGLETQPVQLPDMPAVAGLRFRSPIGIQDADALAAFSAERAARDGLDPDSILENIPTNEEVRAALARAAEEQHLNRQLVAEVSDQVVGLSSIENWHEEDGRWVYLIHGWVLPEWRGRGIGTAMLHWGEQRSRELAAAEHPGELYELAGNASHSASDAVNLLRDNGYTIGYTDLEMEFDLSVSLSEYPLPIGIEMRPARPDHIRLIAESIAESYRSEFPENRFRNTMVEIAGQAEWYGSSVHDQSLWQVAWDSDRVVGQVLPMISHGRAVIDEVSVRPAWRRKGLARALLIRALRDLRSRGIAIIRLYTGAEFRTRARDLYASAGFRVVKQFPRFRKSPG